MINGTFQNCYGLKSFELNNIRFDTCKAALIYAPNGVMKSSLAHVFDDISKGKATSDRIFSNEPTAYSITHYTSQYTYSSANPNNLTSTDRIYVVNSFAEKFEFTKETVSTLLADERTRNLYNILIENFSGHIRRIEEKLRILSGVSKNQIKNRLIKDFGLTDMADWTDIFEKLNEKISTAQNYSFFEECKYEDLFSDKALEVYAKREFISSIDSYISELNNLLADNPVLNTRFTDQRAENLGKALSNNNIFDAQHTIRLKDGVTVIHSLDEWNSLIQEQLQGI